MAHNLALSIPRDPILDLDPWVGQRQASFRFKRSNGITGELLGEITPLRDANLSHDTTRIIKRQLTLSLGVADTSVLNVVSDRITVFMVFPDGTEFPLGRYMFTDASRQVFSSGVDSEHTAGGLANVTLNDEMFMIDQQITKGINVSGNTIQAAIVSVLSDFDITLDVEASPYDSVDSWSVGASRGSVIEALSVSGDYFSPWFGNDGKIHFVRTFNPSARLPDFDFDEGHRVIRDAILETDDLLTAPNRFIVVSNSGMDLNTAIVGMADVPASAPHSISNRGFVIPIVQDLQLSNQSQATAVAQGLARRQTIFERVGLTTAPDPRHDSYNVIRWQGDNWLELGWSMNLTEGATMTHSLRKAYT